MTMEELIWLYESGAYEDGIGEVLDAGCKGKD